MVLCALVALSGCAEHRQDHAIDQALLDQGRRVFVTSGCGRCHTLSAAGTHGTTGPNFDKSEELDPSQIRNQLHLGVGGMPSFRGRLTRREEAAVAAFLSTALKRGRH